MIKHKHFQTVLATENEKINNTKQIRIFNEFNNNGRK